MSGDVGIDLYHHAVSEAYQDFFGEGIYAGKGIYDVRAFSRSVEGIVPDNAVLSHDLLEGILGRAALASDIVVLENASPNLTAELKRQHRWIRGDWQLLPWLAPIGGDALRGRVDLLGKWKLFDNLRRSLLPASLLALFLLGWLFLPENIGAWTLAVASVPGLTIIYSLAGDIRRSPLRWGTLRSTLIRLSASNGKKLGQTLVNLAVLPVVAYSTLDAIIRTLSRLLITHRNLLEWTPSAQSEWKTLGTTLVGSYRRMIAAPVTGSFACMIAIAGDPFVLWPALFGAAFSKIAGMDQAADQWRFVKKACRATIVVSIAAGVALCLAAPLVIPWAFGREFGSAVPSAMILVLAGGIRNVARMLQMALKGCGKPSGVMFSEWGGVAVLLASIGALIPRKSGRASMTGTYAVTT